MLLDITLVTIGIFLFSSVFTGFSALTDAGDRFLFSCTPLLGLNVSVVCLYRLLRACEAGQRLQTQVAQLRAALVEEAVVALRQRKADEGEQFEHLALRERMREGAALEPGGYFQLNNGLFSAAFATIVNYLMVLIAFKIDLS